MTFSHIFVFIGAAFLLDLILKQRGRDWFLLVASILAVFWLQPFSPIRHLDFWMAFTTLSITLMVWLVTRPEHSRFDRETGIAVGITAGLVLLIGLLRYLRPICCITASPPPTWQSIAIALLTLGGLTWLSIRWKKAGWLGATIFMMGIIVIFVSLKTEALTLLASSALRTLNHQPVHLASATDIRWLGFSYIAFRLLHVLRDRRNGKEIALSLKEFMTYVLFFPTLTAGPIDRSQRFAQDLRRPFQLSETSLWQAGERLLLGIFKKFVLADTLSLIALNEVNSSQVISTGWTWILVYAYALRIFFDFAGYTDIAIGIGLLYGIKLPENFDRPYLKPNLTAFWNSWHITLAQWFRAYFFNPLTRSLRANRRAIPLPVIILIGQLSTMVLIGLWHGVTWNFFIWGLWHGAGLFLHNRWSELVRSRINTENLTLWQKRTLNGLGSFFTFQFVTMGWVWFALPTPQASWQILLGLLGLGR